MSNVTGEYPPPWQDIINEGVMAQWRVRPSAIIFSLSTLIHYAYRVFIDTIIGKGLLV